MIEDKGTGDTGELASIAVLVSTTRIGMLRSSGVVVLVDELVFCPPAFFLRTLARSFVGYRVV